MANQAASEAVILIPSLEPDERLPHYVRALMEGGFRHAVIVDDGSAASYHPIFQEIETIPGVTVLHHPKNRGKGAALKTGYRWIDENLGGVSGVITADADGQHTVRDCIRLAEKLKEGERALYLGSRDFSGKNVPFKSSLGNRVTSVLFKLLYGAWLPDTQTGLRAFRREDLRFMAEIPGERFEYEMNVLIACAHQRIPMIPIPIETVYENENRGSHYHPLKDSLRIFRVLARGFIKFMGVSLVCFVIDQALAALLREWLLPLAGLGRGGMWNIQLSGWGARLVSAVINFKLNKDLVFRLRGHAGRAALRYALVCGLIICLSNLGVWLLGQIGMAGWLAKILMDTLLYFLSYQLQDRWVFGEQ